MAARSRRRAPAPGRFDPVAVLRRLRRRRARPRRPAAPAPAVRTGPRRTPGRPVAGLPRPLRRRRLRRAVLTGVLLAPRALGITTWKEQGGQLVALVVGAG